jgi:hypothetical protein
MRRSPVSPSELIALKGAVSLASLVERRTGDIERHGREYAAICPFHAEDTPSFRVYPDGHYHCYGCGEHGDVIDWLRDIERLDFRGAVSRLRELDGLADPGSGTIASISAEEIDWLPITPVPVAAPPLLLRNDWTSPVFNPKRGSEPKPLRPQLVHPYRDANGQLLGYVLRCRFPGGKKFTPCISYCRHKDSDDERWCMVHLPKPRSLYGLDRLAQRPNATVILVEGEKAADAAQRLLPPFVAMTWLGGAKAYQHSDWSPLAVRSVLCVPDADDEGHAAFHEHVDKRGRAIAGIIEVLTAIGAKVRCVAPPLSLKRGWDLANAEEEGWSGNQALAWIKANLSEMRHAA